MRKLISNKSVKQICKLHTHPEIENGILTIRKVQDMSMDYQILLEEKLVEEVMEYIFAPRDTKHGELQDVIDVICSLQRQDTLQGNSNKYSKGYTLENTK